MQFVSLSAERDALRFFIERSMSMGASPASNFAQRFTNELVRQTLIDFDKTDSAYLDRLVHDPATPQSAREWLRARRWLSTKLGKPCSRLATGLGYTDDLFFRAVGKERAVRLLAAWHTVCMRYGVRTAAHHKRQIGQSCIWLGIAFSELLGLVCTPQAKVVHALSRLDAIITGVPTPLSELGKLCGLLQHFRDALDLPALAGYGLYDSFGDLHANPAAIVPCTDYLKRACLAWVNALGQCAAASYSVTVPHGMPG
jgi:hypothetical protein